MSLLITTLVMMWQFTTVISIPAKQDIDWCYINYKVIPCPMFLTPVITSTTTTTTTTTE